MVFDTVGANLFVAGDRSRGFGASVPAGETQRCGACGFVCRTLGDESSAVDSCRLFSTGSKVGGGSQTWQAVRTDSSKDCLGCRGSSWVVMGHRPVRSGVGAAEKRTEAAKGKAGSSCSSKGSTAGSKARHSGVCQRRCNGSGGDAEVLGTQTTLDGTVWQFQDVPWCGAQYDGADGMASWQQSGQAIQLAEGRETCSDNTAHRQEGNPVYGATEDIEVAFVQR